VLTRHQRHGAYNALYNNGLHRVGMLWLPTDSAKEAKRFEYQISPTGNITYGAPGGYHDDCVMALALANHRRWESEGCGRMLRVVDGGGKKVGRERRRERVLVG